MFGEGLYIWGVFGLKLRLGQRFWAIQFRAGKRGVDDMVPNQEPVNWNSFGKVMIVDDEPMMVEFTREFIEKQSLDCEIYENGQDAIDGFLRNRGQVGLVILDIVMPKADGFEAYSAIRAMDPNVKILFYSGYM